MSTKINAQIVADSLSPQGKRLTSVLMTFPRFILAEVNTHRMLSKNTSSSRAIPFNKMVETIQNDPFIPIAWQKDHKGMQGTEYITDKKIIDFKTGVWLQAKDQAINAAKELNGNVQRARSYFDIQELDDTGVTKQLCNRLLEPFMWTTMLITGSEEGWDNFFNLRCPQYSPFQDNSETFKSKKECIEKIVRGLPGLDLMDIIDWLYINEGQAEIHMMQLAECIYDVMNESTPKQLEAGEWHIPFEDKITMSILDQQEIIKKYPNISSKEDLKVRISTAMAARTSYTIVGDEKEINHQKMIELHDRLISQVPLHASPLEHCARSMSDEEYQEYFKGNIHYVGCEQEMYDDKSYSEDVLILYDGQGWCRNFHGFIQYRHILETKNKNLC